ncbi:MAG: prepilin peptidase [Tepidisphaeraceae bacterium]
MDPQALTLAVFVFLIGACVGSFLNVVVYRMPLGLSIVSPPSSCPKCKHRLAAFDNVPILGWLWLRGKCRYCGNPISPRYPIVEFITAALFLAHYLLLFHFGWGPYQQTLTQTIYGTTERTIRPLTIANDWPILVMHLWLIGSLLAASLIDWEHFIIPLEICWATLCVGVVGHALGRPPGTLGSLHFGAQINAATLGAGLGLSLSLLFLKIGVFRRSFQDDAPLLEKDVALLPEEERPDPWPPARIRAEMRREMLFLLPPLVLAGLFAGALILRPNLASAVAPWLTEAHVSGALGSLFGALIGAFVVWFFRIAGSYGFGREAMGLGDVHLMLGVGAIVGPGAATVAFFIAPVFGLSIAIIQLMLRGRREIPYGPYLSLATYAVLLFYTPIAEYLGPGFKGLVWAVHP